MALQQVQVLETEDGQIYAIPVDLEDQFQEDYEDEEYWESEECIAKYAKLRMDDGVNDIKLYADLDEKI